LLKYGKDLSKPFLPLNKNAKRILVAGTHADDLGYQCGGWTKTWFGLSGRITVGRTFFSAAFLFFVDSQKQRPCCFSLVVVRDSTSTRDEAF